MGEERHDRAALFVVERESLGVRDPAMDATPARVDPEQVREAKVVAERGVDHAHGHGDKLPAAPADTAARAARADLVVVGHVDVEHELAQDGPERRLEERLAHRWTTTV